MTYDNPILVSNPIQFGYRESIGRVVYFKTIRVNTFFLYASIFPFYYHKGQFNFNLSYILAGNAVGNVPFMKLNVNNFYHTTWITRASSILFFQMSSGFWFLLVNKSRFV